MKNETPKNKTKKRTLPKKTIYYQDLVNDDFAGTKIKHKFIDENYNFVPKNKFYTAMTYVVRALAFPVIFFIERVLHGVTFKNKKALKGIKGAYLYGNHTSYLDAYTPNLLSFPVRQKFIVNSDAVALKFIGNTVKALGCIPIPDTIRGMSKFMEAVEYCHKRGENITIFPEAHIWPYYNGVRPFSATSFRYPVSDGAPVVAFFTAYQKPKGIEKLIRRIKIVVYLSDVIYPDATLNKKQAQKKLRDDVFEFMKDCSEKYSDLEVIKYVYKPVIDEKCDNLTKAESKTEKQSIKTAKKISEKTDDSCAA